MSLHNALCALKPLLHGQILSKKIRVNCLNSVYEMEYVASAARVVALELKKR